MTTGWDPKALIELLVKETNDLRPLDLSALRSLRQRAHMYIRRIFGESSPHLAELQKIYLEFFPTSRGGPGDYENRQRDLWPNGKIRLIRLFITMQEELTVFGSPHTPRREKAEASNRIFVVHGHDAAMKESVARMLAQLELEPIILHERPSKGRTIIEKIENYSDVGFAVVLLSPDDEAHSRDEPPELAVLQPRQNAIFELGFFVGLLGRDRVAVIHSEEKFEMLSDYSGVVYIPFDPRGKWQLDLVNELQASGYNVDANKLVKR